MQEEPSDQFLALQVHYLGSVLVAIILVAQPDRVVLEAHNAPIVEGGLAAVAAEIVHDGVGVTQVSLGVDPPLGAHQLIEPRIDLAWAGDTVQFTAVGG